MQAMAKHTLAQAEGLATGMMLPSPTCREAQAVLLRAVGQPPGDAELPPAAASAAAIAALPRL